jgi:hypothetical protein
VIGLLARVVRDALLPLVIAYLLVVFLTDPARLDSSELLRNSLLMNTRSFFREVTPADAITSEAEAGFSGPKSDFIHSSLVSRRALCSASRIRRSRQRVRNRVGRCICPYLASNVDRLARRNRPADSESSGE